MTDYPRPAGKDNNSDRISVWRSVGLPSRSVALHRATLEGFPAAVVGRCAKITGIDQSELVAAIGLSTRLWKKRQDAGRLNSRESDNVYRLLRIWDEAWQLFEGDTAAARRWVLSPALGLDDARPVDFARTSAEFDCVLDLIGRLETGQVV